MPNIILDLEWNQALSKDAVRKKGFTLIGEIIQIGAVRMGEDGEIADEIRILVAPKYYKKMHWSVRKLTRITTKSLADGLPFPEAYEKFAAWCGEGCTLFTWGPDDIPMLRDNLRLHGMPTDMPPYYDLQRIFAREIAGEKRQFSLDDALARLGITEAYEAHDALNDAKNTAAVCAKLNLDAGILHYNDPFPKREPEPPQLPLGQKPEMEGTFDTYEEMIAAMQGTPLLCPDCGEVLAPEKWVRRAPGKRINIASCGCAASFSLKISWAETRDGHFRAWRVVSPATEAQIGAYRHARAHRRRSRRQKPAEIAPSA